MKVLIFWSHISGYMAACWRALAQTPGYDTFVFARASGGAKAHTNFRSDLMAGIPHKLVDSDGPISEAEVREAVAQQKPDIIAINGWHTPAYVAIPNMPEAAGAKFIMAMDTPYQATLRQHLGRHRFASFFKRMDAVFVTGERCWQLAKVLGFDEAIIRRGVYGVDFSMLAPLHERRVSQPGGWPRRFLTTGRYVEEKGIDVLIEGYDKYRRAVTDPWPLTCCGQGPLAPSLSGVEGITDRGFVQPTDLPNVLVEHGAFVLASRFDPWPLVVVEACAAGLPIVCSEACGSRVELLRYCYNGRSFATGDSNSLAGVLRWIHDSHLLLPELGRGSRAMAEPYSAQMWVRRWSTAFDELMAEKR